MFSVWYITVTLWWASKITSLPIVCSTAYSGADQRKHQSSASLAFVRGIHRWPVNSPHKGPVTLKMFPFDDVIMVFSCCVAAANFTHILWGSLNWHKWMTRLPQCQTTVKNVGKPYLWIHYKECNPNSSVILFPTGTVSYFGWPEVPFTNMVHLGLGYEFHRFLCYAPPLLLGMIFASSCFRWL